MPRLGGGIFSRALAKFVKDIERFVNKGRFLPHYVIKDVYKEFYGEILARSPIKTERFRDSNRIGIGSVDATVEPPRSGRVGNTPYPGGPKLEEGEAIIDNANLGVFFQKVVYFSNNLPYAQLLEDGYSRTQAPGPNAIYGAAYDDIVSRLDSIVRRSIQRGHGL